MFLYLRLDKLYFCKILPLQQNVAFNLSKDKRKENKQGDEFDINAHEMYSEDFSCKHKSNSLVQGLMQNVF